jgi:hypothetical protein
MERIAIQSGLDNKKALKRKKKLVTTPVIIQLYMGKYCQTGKLKGTQIHYLKHTRTGTS